MPPLVDAVALVCAKQLIGDAATNYSITNARLGIGDGSTAFAKTHTDLQGTNKLRKAVDAAPLRTGTVLRFSATFGPTEANWDWKEWGPFNAGPTGGDMMSRKVETPSLSGGVAKPSGQTWQLVVDVAISV